MKRSILNLGLFVALAAVVANLAGCAGTSASQSGPSDDASTAAVANPNEAKNKASAPLSEALSQGEFRNVDGSTFNIAGRHGNVLLVNMWATWCGPCRSEMKDLVRMQDAHRDQGFEVIGLNVDDESADAINDFAKDMQLNYTLAWADMDLQVEFLKMSGFDGIPQSFIIDRNGQLRAIFKGADPDNVKKMGEIVSQIVNE